MVLYQHPQLPVFSRGLLIAKRLPFHLLEGLGSGGLIICSVFFFVGLTVGYLKVFSSLFLSNEWKFLEVSAVPSKSRTEQTSKKRLTMKH